MNMREQFEAWSAGHDYLGGVGLHQGTDGKYSDADLQHAWEAWQAACATTCPGHGRSDCVSCCWPKGRWNGLGLPPVGLPPVGTVCEYKHVSEWQQVEVFAVKPNHNGSPTALFTYENETWCGCAEPSFFRPIRTAEQIAAEVREGAIHEMVDHLKRWHTVQDLCGDLYDAGYRKQVQP